MPTHNLLIPTDFSDQSQHALCYGLKLAKDINASVHILNSYYIPVNSIEADYVADQALWVEQARQRAQEEMKLLEDRHLKKAGVPYSCQVHPGPPLNDINETIREHAIDLLIMGIFKSDQMGGYFGDLFSHAIRNAKAPVLLVPESCPYIFPKKVVFASDLKPIETDKPINTLCQLFTSLKTELLLLHVYKPEERLSVKRKEEMAYLKRQFSSLHPKIALVEAAETEKGILDYTRGEHAQWLSALAHHYGLLEGLFHSSRTKKLARNTDIPLLVSHE